MDGAGAMIGDALGMDTPEAPSFQQAPNPGDAEVQKKLQAAAAAERRAKGRASTLLTGGEGDQSQASVSRRTLLGA